MEYSYLTKPLSINPLDEVVRRVWVYLPLLLNLASLRFQFLPSFLERNSESTFGLNLNLRTACEPLSMLSLVTALYTFQRQFELRRVEACLEKKQLVVQFNGAIPAAFNMVINLTKLVIYLVLRSRSPDNSLDAPTKVKLVITPAVLLLGSIASLAYSLFYKLTLSHARTKFYLKVSGFWKMVHSVCVVLSFAFAGFFHKDHTVRIIFKITFLIIAFFMFRSLQQKEKTFVKLYFVNDVVKAKVLFLILLTILYFEGFRVFEFLVQKKSIEATFRDQEARSYWTALVLYVICCRHVFYFQINILASAMVFGNSHDHVLMRSAFPKRNAVVIRQNTQFYYYFMERILGIMNMNSKDIITGGELKKGFLKEMVSESREVKDKFMDFMRTRFVRDETTKSWSSLTVKEKTLLVGFA